MYLKSLCFFTLFFSVSCSHKFSAKENCSHRDWYEVGRQDGIRGAKSSAFKEHTKNCQLIKKEVVQLYKKGRMVGLTTYCQPQNAYELGRLNQTYHHVCPAPLESAFLESYKKGKAFFIKEQTSKNTESEAQKIVQ